MGRQSCKYFFQKKTCIFFKSMVTYRSCLSTAAKNPGVAKFGIALEWGSRGPEFESQHSDHLMIIRTLSSKLGDGFGFIISIENILQVGATNGEASWWDASPPVIIFSSVLQYEDRWLSSGFLCFYYRLPIQNCQVVCNGGWTRKVPVQKGCASANRRSQSLLRQRVR